MEISEKVAYLKGLAEGLALDTESKEGKLISVMIGILEEIGLSIEDLEENTQALGEEIDVLSDDLSDVEEVVFDDEDDDDEFTNKLLGEWAYEQFDNIPSVGDSFRYENVEVTVSEMHNNRILRLRVRLIDEGGEEK